MRFALLFIAVIVWGQPQVTQVRLYPQQRMVGNLQEFAISICNQGQQQMHLHAARVWAAAFALGLSPATYTNVLAEAERVNSMSWQRKGLLIAELTGWGFTAADQAGLFKIGNDKKPARWKATVPIFSGFLRGATTWLRERPPPVQSPEQSRLLPVYFTIPAKGCVDYLIYGTMRPERSPGG